MQAIQVSEVKTYLECHGIKPSAQRIAIMHYLMLNRIHPSVDTIYSALVNDIPTLSRTTVYNTLWLFVEQGAVSSLNIDRHNVRFDYSEYPHAHFFCHECSEIFDIPLQRSQVVKSVNNKALHIEQMDVYYRGVCSDCMAKK